MIHLYFHGGSGNHGCEAIVRSTLGILGKDAVLHTSNINSDRAYGLDQVTALKEDVTQPLSRQSVRYLMFALHRKLTGTDYLYTRFSHDAFFLVSAGEMSACPSAATITAMRMSINISCSMIC